MPDSTARQLVVFTLGAEEYALPIDEVQEIIRFDEPRSVASTVNWVRGVISLRGRIIAVYDLAARLGGAETKVVTETSKIVIIDTAADTAGVIVDDVREVITIEPEQLDAAPAADSTFVEAIARIDDRLVVLLRAGGLFAADDAAPVPAAAAKGTEQTATTAVAA